MISREAGSFKDLHQALEENEMLTVTTMDSPEQLFDEIEKSQVDIVIVDDVVPGATGLQFVRELMRSNPYINCALVSSLYPSEFHEETEGLGVFMQLSKYPGQQAAQDICAHLEKIY